MGVDVPFYYFDNYEETMDGLKDYILHQDSHYCQVATSYNLWEKFGIIFHRDCGIKILESLMGKACGIKIFLPHFYMPPNIFSRLSPKFNGSQTQSETPWIETHILIPKGNFQKVR